MADANPTPSPAKNKPCRLTMEKQAYGGFLVLSFALPSECKSAEDAIRDGKIFGGGRVTNLFGVTSKNRSKDPYEELEIAGVVMPGDQRKFQDFFAAVKENPKLWLVMRYGDGSGFAGLFVMSYTTDIELNGSGEFVFDLQCIRWFEHEVTVISQDATAKP